MRHIKYIVSSIKIPIDKINRVCYTLPELDEQIIERDTPLDKKIFLLYNGYMEEGTQSLSNTVVRVAYHKTPRV